MTLIVKNAGVGSNGRTMRFLAILSLLSPVAACQTAAPTIDQGLYDACVSDYNSEFRFKPRSRAMVSGSGYGSTGCFWVWAQPSQSVAKSRALANCHKKKGLCEVFADDNGLVGWSRRISNNGGRDPDIRRSYSRPSVSHGSYSNYNPYSTSAGDGTNIKIVNGRVTHKHDNREIYRGSTYHGVRRRAGPGTTISVPTPSWHKGCRPNGDGSYNCNPLVRRTGPVGGSDAVR